MEKEIDKICFHCESFKLKILSNGYCNNFKMTCSMYFACIEYKQKKGVEKDDIFTDNK